MMNTYESYDKLPFPVLITDNNGKICYKNKFAYKAKFIRINTNVSLLFEDETAVKFINCLNSGKSGVFPCIKAKGVSYCITVKIGENENVLFFILNSRLKTWPGVMTSTSA